MQQFIDCRVDHFCWWQPTLPIAFYQTPSISRSECAMSPLSREAYNAATDDISILLQSHHAMDVSSFPCPEDVNGMKRLPAWSHCVRACVEGGDAREWLCICSEDESPRDDCRHVMFDHAQRSQTHRQPQGQPLPPSSEIAGFLPYRNLHKSSLCIGLHEQVGLHA